MQREERNDFWELKEPEEWKPETVRVVPGMVKSLAVFALFLIFIGMAVTLLTRSIRVATASTREVPRATHVISGYIRDTSGKPVPWAEITAVGTPDGVFVHTLSDQNGFYSVDSIEQPHRLEVHAEGYETGWIEAGSKWFFVSPMAPEHRDLRLERR